MSLKLLAPLLTAAALAAPVPASATMLDLKFFPKSLDELGSCLKVLPGGCTDLVGKPPGGDSSGLFDRLTLSEKTITIDTTVPTPLSQPFVFYPGDTGAGSLGFVDVFSLDRTVLITGKNAGGTLVGLTQKLSQSGSVTVGMFEDKLNIFEATMTIDLTIFGLTGSSLVLLFSPAELVAGIDPPGEITGGFRLVGPAAVPIPPTLALLALGLIAGGIARRLSAKLP